MGASTTTKILLAFKSGCRCAMPDCGQELATNGDSAPMVTIGEAAHIAGENEGSARYDPNMTQEQRNGYGNLLYLCPTCHTKIDKQEDEYPIAKLHDIKAKHESTVELAIENGFAKVGFPELEEVTTKFSQIEYTADITDFSVIAPAEKLAKNLLTGKSKLIITSALGIMSQVKMFVEKATETDPDLPMRLKAGFLQEYYRLRKDGIIGDELFEMMCNFAQQGYREQVRKSAGLAILVYYFEICEIFEK